ncbi:filamentous hemagglutinin N-terminal domain-containing protein [Candidatus Parabeggiatoa sp. HSG14]|uniref:two-partner secretion domain-containing protein n=1 Tax=Candidatus Parabeggiatoa sp. HSG14 TaxID=3055593 RepID=UPI0025A8D8A4|nr:filamentous hemagglutinin N-terminal domain-containing protein [Thiotrichales bacterium HSG14]
MKPSLLLTIVLLIISLSTNAEITTDGSLGTRANLPGHDYLIGADLGQQLGGNLFHSFQDFNLNSLESATFSGPNNVQNILSRVTGGNPSNIDGLIRSTIPNADMYFLNPYGIIFGLNARLDVQGSFHASTADYLRLGENGRFDARQPSDSILIVAPIEAFGFLIDSPASIKIIDSSLQVLPTKTLSLSAGDISLTNSQTPIYDEASYPTFANQLVAASGEIILDAQDTISLQNFGVDTSGVFGGQISIIGNKLEMNDSQISSHTFGEFDGYAIDIQVDNLFMQDSDIIANTYGAGRGSAINLQINENLIATRFDRPIGIEFGFSLRGSSHISTLTAGDGNIGTSGDITIQAGNIDLHNAAEIRSRSVSNAKSGNITLQVADTFQMTDTVSLGFETLPIGGVNSLGFTDGDSGNIDIIAQRIMLDKGGVISATTFGVGQGGSIFVQADTISLKDQGELTGLPTAIDSVTLGTGQAGKLEINARMLTLEDGGAITTNSFSSGNSNELVVNISDTLTISGITKLPYQIIADSINITHSSSITSGSSNSAANGGQASNIYIQAKHIILKDGGAINSMTVGGGSAGNAEIVADTINVSGWQGEHHSEINNSSASLESYAGLAGNIDVTANKITISDSGTINSSAINAGGGNITINAKDIVYLSDQGSITTSVQSGIGDGGNINIVNPRFTVLNQAYTVAQADEGHGGNIHLKSEKFITSPDSLISASSRLGIDGEVKIDSPTIDMNAFLVVLPAGFVEAQLRKCTIEEIENPSTFKVNLTHDRRKELPFGKFLKFK